MIKIYTGTRAPDGCRVTVQAFSEDHVQTTRPDGETTVTRLLMVAGPAEPLRHVVWHSPTGFEWGYHGSGPADLALSILADHFGERQTPTEARAFDAERCPQAARYHQAFKREIIAELPGPTVVVAPEFAWTLESTAVDAWIA